MTNFVCRSGNNYYPQVFLSECKYIVKEKKMSEYNTDNITNYITRVLKLIFEAYEKLYFL